MNVTPLNIPDVLCIKPEVFEDERGFFMETFQRAHWQQAGLRLDFVQENHSGSMQGTLRGLHYQIEHAQGKVVRVVAGEIYDVAVDLRRSSATFSQWVGMMMSAAEKQQLWIPPGFAHGFYVLSDWAEIIYKVTDIYAPEHERTLLWNNPALMIDWPLIPGLDLILSEKDSQGLLLQDAECYD